MHSERSRAVARFSLLLMALAGPSSSAVDVLLQSSGTTLTTNVCNETADVLDLRGYRFRSAGTGFSTFYRGTITHPTPFWQHDLPPEDPWLGSNPISTGNCIAGGMGGGISLSYSGGAVSGGQSMIKTGSCTGQVPYTDAQPLTCTELDAATAEPGYYDTGLCLEAELGKNGGPANGGWVATFAGQTQLQYAIPSTSFTVNLTSVQWNPDQYGGPLYMMAIAAGQEIMNAESY